MSSNPTPPKVGDKLIFEVGEKRTIRMSETYLMSCGQVAYWDFLRGTDGHYHVLHRIPACDGVMEFPEGWTWRRAKDGDALDRGAFLLWGSCHESFEEGHIASKWHTTLLDGNIVLIPPQPNPPVAPKVKTVRGRIDELRASPGYPDVHPQTRVVVDAIADELDRQAAEIAELKGKVRT